MKYSLSALIAMIINLHVVAGLSVSLKDSHDVQREFLSLSDFFEGVPENLDQEILESPAQGQSKHYPHAWVRRLAQNFGFSWDPTHFKGITLGRTDLKTVSVDAAPLIKDYMAQHYADKISDDTNIVFDTASSSTLKITANKEPVLENFSWIDSNRFLATFNLDGTEKKVRGTLSKTVYVPVLNKDVNSGYVVAKEDIEYKGVPEHKVTPHVARHQEDLIGKSLKRRISAGNILSQNDMVSPVAIKRGDLVSMRVETPTIVITVRGKAQGNGAIGDTLQVMNMESKKLIDGIVKDSQTVVVPVTSR